MKTLSVLAAVTAIAAGTLVLTSSADARTVRHSYGRHVYGAFGVPYLRSIPYFGYAPYVGGGGFYGRSYGGPWGHSGPRDSWEFQGAYD